MLEVLVNRLHAHGQHTLGDQVANRVVRHGRDNRSLKPEAIRQVCRHVELAAAHVNVAFRCLAKWNDPRVEPVHQRSQ